MPPKVQITSALGLQTRYSELLTQAPYVDAQSPYLLHKALSTSIRITAGVVKQWWSLYRVAEGEVRLSSAAELEERYGDTIRHYAVEHPTAFKLCKALRQRSPPICISDSSAKQWLKLYGGQAVIADVNSAGHLEMRYGDRNRAHTQFNSPDALASWSVGCESIGAYAGLPALAHQRLELLREAARHTSCGGALRRAAPVRSVSTSFLIR